MAEKTGNLDWLTIGEAAKYLGVSRDTLRRWEKRGKIKSYRTPGGRRRYTMYDLELAMRTTPKPVPFTIRKPEPPKPKPEPKEEAPRYEEPTEPSKQEQPTVVQQVPSIWSSLLRTLVLGFAAAAIIVALLILLPMATNLLLTYLRGSGGILSPIP